MDVIPNDANKQRETFLRLLFSGGKGYICIAYAPRNLDRKKFREEFFRFPEEVDDAVNLIDSLAQGHHVWFCPHLFTQRKRRKEFVAYTPCAWSDLDSCPPELLRVTPTITIQSSGARYQALWVFADRVDPDDAENLSQRIAYAHAQDGADRSGWDLTQLLRFPLTYNYKYAQTPMVRIIEANTKRYRLSDFDNDYDKVQAYTYVDRDMPSAEDLPDGDELLQANRLKMNPTIWRLYQEELPDDQSWSEPLWKLENLLFEAGFDAVGVYAIVRGAACNKYAREGMGSHLLWKDVCRAEARHKAEVDAYETGKLDYQAKPLVTDEEREAVQAEDSFVERYIAWAKSLGDAAPQYHQAGAFTALSALLAGSVQLPTSFGTIKPNLWFMILADTTLTRKSTAMDIAMDLITEIDSNILMATDGSIEGLLTVLGTRPGQPSVFLHDEFSGLLEMITKKDYYAGMPELLTKLYDGKLQKRVLRKEMVEVKDPCLLVFAGGIKDKITSILNFEHVASGFMPRFIFITAESDITRVKPLGPPTDWTDDNRQAIMSELQDVYEFYGGSKTFIVNGSDIRFSEPIKHDAKLTSEAWFRYNQIETQMLDAGVHSERPEIMTPVYDRLSKSILKAAVLLACSRQRNEVIEVEEKDIIRAAVYGESWRKFVREIMSSVGKGQAERLLDNIVRTVHRKPGVTRSYIMQSYHLNARDTTQVLETLEQRGLITRTKNGTKAEVLHPVEQRMKVSFK